MEHPSTSLRTALNRIKSDSADPFKRKDGERFELMLEKASKTYPCLRCEHSSFHVPWIPPNPKQGREFGAWQGPFHVGCKVFLRLPEYTSESDFTGFLQPFEEFHCTSEQNDNSNVGSSGFELSEYRSPSGFDGERQSPAPRESDRG